MNACGDLNGKECRGNYVSKMYERDEMILYNRERARNLFPSFCVCVCVNWLIFFAACKKEVAIKVEINKIPFRNQMRTFVWFYQIMCIKVKTCKNNVRQHDKKKNVHQFNTSCTNNDSPSHFVAEILSVSLCFRRLKIPNSKCERKYLYQCGYFRKFWIQGDCLLHHTNIFGIYTFNT